MTGYPDSSFASYLALVRRHRRLIAITLAVTVALASAITIRSESKYESDASVLVGFEGPALDNETALAQQNAQVGSFAQLVDSQEMRDRAAARLGRESLEGEVIVETQGGALIRVAAEAASAERAQEIADAYAAEAAQLISGLDVGPLAATADVVSSAALPTGPSSSIVAQALRNYGFALLTGIALGIAIAIVYELLDSRIRGRRELGTRFGLQTLAEIPRDPGLRDANLANRFSQPSSGVADGGELTTRTIERFRALGTAVTAKNATAGGLTTAIVASPSPGDGRTTIACNLAAALAETGESVLLVDLDLRNPSVGRLLGLSGEPGVAEVLAGELDLSDALREVGPLTVLPAGDPRSAPPECFAADAFRELMSAVEDDWDQAVVDTPPILEFNDAGQVARRAGRVLLAVREKQTTLEDVEGALHRLNLVDAQVAGAVLNIHGNAKAHAPSSGGPSQTGRAAEAELARS